MFQEYDKVFMFIGKDKEMVILISLYTYYKIMLHLFCLEFYVQNGFTNQFMQMFSILNSILSLDKIEYSLNPSLISIISFEILTQSYVSSYLTFLHILFIFYNLFIIA